MPHIRASAIVVATRAHGEHGVVARLLTRDHGVLAGYVRGGRSRRMRPVLIAGNVVEAELHSRSAEQLAGLTVELVTSRGPWLDEPLAASAINWVSALTVSTLPEELPYPDLYDALSALLDAVCNAPSARGWTGALARYELLLLERLGFALDLESCAATGGSEDLVYVSPRSGQAVSRAGASGHEAKLLRLPRFLLDGSRADWPDLFDALALTGFFIERSFFAEHRRDVMAARKLLVERLKRAHVE